MPSGYKKNFKNHAVMIPRFAGVDTGLTGITFGGFLCDKYVNSQPSAKNEAGTGWYDVAHSAVPGTIPGISKPGDPVWDYIDFPKAMVACANKGKGWHLLTDFEWAALAFLAKKQGTMPHGGNANTNPPSDATYTTETAQLDRHMKAETPNYNRALPGTGPAAWADNHLASGVYDLQGLVNQWVCMMMDTSGYPQVSANLDLSYEGSPFGRGTISGTDTLTCDGAGVNWKKAWETYLQYDAEAATFTAGYLLLGMTSGATAIITQVIDSGTTGILKIRRTSSAAFSDNEVIHAYASAATTKSVSATADSAGAIKITTSAVHGLTNGDLVTIKSVVGTTEANNDDSNPAWAVTVVDTTSFTLDGSTYSNPWSSGGTVYKVTGVGGCAASNGTEVGEFAIKYQGYDGAVGNFTLGTTVTGALSGKTGIIVSDNDSGDYGTLGLISADAAFTDDEELQVSAAKVAVANGTGQSCQLYYAEYNTVAGGSFAITASTPTTLTLAGSPTDGTCTFWLHKTIVRDITDGMTSGHKILTLRDSDNDLNAFALPATADGTGAAAYGNDGYYFDKVAARAALRGGYFNITAIAGVFFLDLSRAPSNATIAIGFRAAKAL